MKKNAIGIALLNATDAGDGWYQLLPAGRFKARDGRPFDVPDGWLMNADIAARLIAGVRALAQDVLIDYEHNQRRKDVGLAPDALKAAGWFNADEMQWREGQGLFIHPRWTDAAQSYIDGKEFGFLSAVFPYDDNGEPLQLRMVALTNDPGITGMKKLAVLMAEFSPQEEHPMNEKLRQLLARLGITVAENLELSDEQATAALSALDALSAKADKHGELSTRVATLSAELSAAKTTVSGAVDLTKWVPVETVNALRTQLAEVSGKHSIATLSAVIDAAEQDGRIFKCERSYFEQLGGQIGVAALSAQLDQKQPIAALAAQQTETANITVPGKEKIAVLSADEMAAVKALGMTGAEFVKIRDEGKTS